MIRLFLINVSVILILSGCIRPSNKTLSTKKVTIDGREMLYGHITREQLYFDYPDWKQIENQYEPSADIINQLRMSKDSISVDIFLGTWCSDSRREVPAFFKIIDLAMLNDKIDVNIWAVDRNKNVVNGLAQKCKIEFVPTFIFYKINTEIGRIVEMPDGILEEDILAIILRDNE